jgi:NAD(P)-dependent dehydrogenase (short-subunit alcohol dehydrogenase family)
MCGSDFAGKVALVTGGASGIGEACVRTFALDGARVVVADTDVEGGERVAATAKRLGGDALFVRCDVSDPQAVERTVEAAIESFGGLDLAVNNAGVAGAADLVGDYGVDEWRRVIDVNLNGVFYCLRAEIPRMVERGGGAIVNMASILGSLGFAAAPAYVAAKHGVVGLTKTAALEYAKQGIRINAVGPGFVRTPMLAANLDEPTETRLSALHAMGRLGEPQEVADLVAYLCSENASFLTGGFYLADGGYSAQ